MKFFIASALGFASVKAMGNLPYAPTTIEEAWDNHFSAFGEQDVAKIGLDYGDSSVVQVYSACEQTTSEYVGRESIEGLFEELFAELYDTTTLAVHALDEYENGVFLVWSNAGTGFDEVTDTFIFDKNTNAILQQNIVVASADCEFARRGRNLLQDQVPDQAAVDGSWDNHFSAFGGQDLPAILEDYVEESTVAVYSFHDGSLSYFDGLSEIEALFAGLFSDLEDLTNLNAPVDSTVADPVANTFLVWNCPACYPDWEEQYALVTDTFVYSGTQLAENGPAIIRQNIVIFTAL